LSYFYAKGLRLTVPDDCELDPDCWLDAASAGALLHELFRRFLSELVSRDLLPDAERDRPRLRTLLDELIDEYRQRTPPPTHAAFESQRRDLVRASEAFLSSEVLLCRSHRPRYFEASIGVEPCGPGSPLDQDEPGELTLSSGRRVRIRGRVDRIDEILETPGSFAIWDYKTGSDWSYRQEDPFRQGRRVQSALYRSLTEAVLRSKIDPAARVTSFGYFFTGARTHGLRLAWTEDRLLDGLRLVDALATVIASGAFLPTDDASDCKYCDFAAACGEVVQLAENSSSCLDGGDARVVPHRELRRNG
jgi:RecB family exonuclease